MLDQTNYELTPACFSTGDAWFAAYTDIAAEPTAIKEITNCGFNAFTPMAVRFLHKHGHKREINEPVFQRYVFVEFDRELDDWGSIDHLDGVQFVIKNNMMPVKIPTIIIDRLQRAQEAGVFSPKSALAINDRVEIEEGPFKNLIGKVASASPRKRIKVLLNVLGRDTAVDIDPCYLKKLR